MSISFMSFLGIHMASLLVLMANLYQYHHIQKERQRMLSQLEQAPNIKRRRPYTVVLLYVLSTGILMLLCGWIFFFLLP